MSQDVFEIIKNMDSSNLETQLALQCSPLIAGLKISNLFTISALQEKELENILAASDISCKRLYGTKDKVTYLLYNTVQLQYYLKSNMVKSILYHLGYSCSMDDNISAMLSALLSVFTERYAGYMEGKCAFPHEMGIFLGYPVEDVIGYLKNDGKNCKCVGYWKVYKNVEEKQRLFREFECAQENIIRYLAQGLNVLEVMRYYNWYKIQAN